MLVLPYPLWTLVSVGGRGAGGRFEKLCCELMSCVTVHVNTHGVRCDGRQCSKASFQKRKHMRTRMDHAHLRVGCGGVIHASPEMVSQVWNCCE